MQNWMKGALIALVSVAGTLAISQMMRGPVEEGAPDSHGVADRGRETGPERHLAGRRYRPTGICRIIRREPGPCSNSAPFWRFRRA